MEPIERKCIKELKYVKRAIPRMKGNTTSSVKLLTVCSLKGKNDDKNKGRFQ